MSSSQREQWAEDARQRFENRYERLPSWETGRPQPCFVELEREGSIRGAVLDAGCGSGENALYLADRGHPVWGVDIAPTAIGLARAKAQQRGQAASRFLVTDALALESLGLLFDTVIDSGLFHALNDGERAAYVASLARVLRPDGGLHILCFSSDEPGSDGPRRIARHEIAAAFAEGWIVEAIEDCRFETNTHDGGARALLASLRRRQKGDTCRP